MSLERTKPTLQAGDKIAVHIMSTPSWIKALGTLAPLRGKSSSLVLKYFSSLLEGWADCTLTATMMRLAPGWALFWKNYCHFSWPKLKITSNTEGTDTVQRETDVRLQG